MHRREFNLLLGSIALSACASTRRSTRGPLFWRAQRGNSRVYLLGAAEAKDRSWLTPTIADAFAGCDELWLETPAPPSDPDAQRQRDALLKELGYEQDRTFFDALEADVRERARVYVTELELDFANISRMRPWLAYYSINSRFWSKRAATSPTENSDSVLREMAMKAGKVVQHEFPTYEALLRFFATMPDTVQSQYIEMLLDYLDDENAGRNGIYQGWVVGRPSSRALDRMRNSTPALYETIQAGRNRWWAAKVDQLLEAEVPKFVLLGMNHMLGPYGVPALIERARIDLQEIG